MASEPGDDIPPKRPPVPGDLPYREPPIIEGRAESVHAVHADDAPAEGASEVSADASTPVDTAVPFAGEPTAYSAAADEVPLPPEADPFAPPPDSVEPPLRAASAPQRRWPIWPLALAALIGLIPGLAALYLAQQLRQEDPANAVAALRGDVGRLSARLDGVERRPDAGPVRDAVTALDKRIAAVETLARGAQSASDKAAADAKAASAAAQAVAQRPAPEAAPAPVLPQVPVLPPPDLNPLTEHIGQVDARVGSLDQKLDARVGSIDQKLDARVANLDQKLGAVDSRLGALQAKIDQPKTDARAATADKDTDSDTANSSAALAVVAQAVLQALPRGAPFPTELAALKSLKADPARIAALEPLAQSGAPTPRALADRFRPLADEITKQDQPREGSFFERIMASASHLVSVRSVGEKAGSDPAALVSQIQAALDRGDLVRARDLWTALPDRGKARSQDWARALDARIAVDNAAQSLASEAIARLAKPRS